MTELTKWVEVLDGWTLEYKGGSHPPGHVFELPAFLAAEYVGRNWVRIVDAPEAEPEPDRSGYLPVRVRSEIHLTGRSYAEGEVLDLSPSEAEWYVSLGAVEVIE